MFKTITEQQIENLRVRFSERGAAADFCKRAEIKTAALSQIITGKRRRVNGDLYALLFPDERRQHSVDTEINRTGVTAAVILDISEAMAEFAERLAGIAHAMNMKKPQDEKEAGNAQAARQHRMVGK